MVSIPCSFLMIICTCMSSIPQCTATVHLQQNTGQSIHNHLMLTFQELGSIEMTTKSNGSLIQSSSFQTYIFCNALPLFPHPLESQQVFIKHQFQSRRTTIRYSYFTPVLRKTYKHDNENQGFRLIVPKAPSSGHKILSFRSQAQHVMCTTFI